MIMMMVEKKNFHCVARLSEYINFSIKKKYMKVLWQKKKVMRPNFEYIPQTNEICIKQKFNEKYT